MAGRTKYPRKATAATSSDTPPQDDALSEASEEEEEEDFDEDVDETSDEDDDDEYQEPGSKRSKGKGRGKKGAPSPKKRKTAKGKGKKQRNEPDGPDLLVTMPVEVLGMIFAYLLPDELLELSRTAKVYHALLSSKKSRPFWSASRKLVGLPDLKSPGVSEMFYAELMFGERCQFCTKKTPQPDFTLRIRWCKECAKENLVKLESLDKTHPDLHPLVTKVVFSTQNSRWRCSPDGSHRYALEGELQQMSRRLYELEDDDEAEGFSPVSAVPSPSATKGRSNKYTEPAFSEDDLGPNVSSFLEERQELVALALKDAEKLFNGFKAFTAKRSAYQRKWATEMREIDRWQQEHAASRSVRDVRIQKIKEKAYAVFGLWECYRLAWRSSKVINQEKEFTDGEWPKVRVEVEKLIKRAQANNAAYSSKQRIKSYKSSRAATLKARYDAHYDSQADDKLRFSMPLWPDFVRLGSVQDLLVGTYDGKKQTYKVPAVSDQEWTAAMPSIEEEIEQYRLESFLHAVKLILSATTDEDDGLLPDDDEILSNLEDYGDAFFERATSIVVCSIEGCGHARKYKYDWRTRRSETVSVALTFAGSRSEVLEHLHKVHHKSGELDRWDLMDYFGRSRATKTPQFHFDLPLEVACVTSGLCEVGELDPETATIEDLDTLDAGHYRWDNPWYAKKNYSSWRSLVDTVYRKGYKAAHSRPRRTLPPPCIIYTPARNKNA
ncbi:hypothetical protein JCM10207_009193 [Rhodosporidiobolus poonsookiae]